MLDSIQIALTGMTAFQRGLTVISNNVSNLNTPGFRGSNVEFSNLFFDPQDGSGGRDAGVDSSQTQLDTRAGQPHNTGNDLDLFLDGAGYFIVKDEQGQIFYTRNGEFEIDPDTHNLVVRGQKLQVMGFGADGQLAPISVASLLTTAAKATTTVTFKDNLSPTDPDVTIDGINVIDANGKTHTLSVLLTRKTDSTAGTNVVSWDMTVSEAGVTLATGTGPQFVGSLLQPGSLPTKLTLAFTGAPPLDVSFDFAAVQGAQPATTPPATDPSARASTISFSSSDDKSKGVLSAETFDATGVMKLTYTNGETANGPVLALAEIPDDQVDQVDHSLVKPKESFDVVPRKAGDNLKVVPQSLEGSNVDLTSEFTKIILMQRGYQAASEVLSTANQMLQELMDVRGGTK